MILTNIFVEKSRFSGKEGKAIDSGKYIEEKFGKEILSKFQIKYRYIFSCGSRIPIRCECVFCSTLLNKFCCYIDLVLDFMLIYRDNSNTSNTSFILERRYELRMTLQPTCSHP